MRYLVSVLPQDCRRCQGVRGFSSIFDVVRQRRRERLAKERADAVVAPPASEASEVPKLVQQAAESSVKQIWKQFSVLRSKPAGYRDLWQLRYLSVRALELLPITSAEELCKITEVLAHMKYRNVVLMQGICEAFFWQCKLGKCKLRDLTCFLRACATLKFVPSFRHLEVFLAELDNVHQKPSVGDHLRVLQFLVENGLDYGDVFMDVFDRCRKHCLDNMGFMTHQHLASFSQTQLLIDSTDWKVFDRICLNFERNLKEGEFAHFLMLSNALVRAETRELSVHYPRLLGHHLDFSEKWSPGLVNTVLRVLEKHYYRDTVALSKLGNIVVKHIAAFTADQACTALNRFASLSYKHKELIHGVMKSQLPGWWRVFALDGVTVSSDIAARLKVLAGVANMLAKVDYKPVAVMRSITDRTIQSLEMLSENGLGSTKGRIPWIVREMRTMQPCQLAGVQAGWHPAPMVLTGSMVLDMVSSGVKGAVEHEKEPVRARSASRRLLWRSTDRDNTGTVTADLGKLKVVPVSVDVRRHQSLKECLAEFFNVHFDGRHPAARRLEMRKQMRRQTRELKLRRGFDSSSVLKSVRLEKKSRVKLNTSYRKLKRKMHYSGSRHVQTTQYYINECRVLKRCFLRPYKTITSLPQSKSGLGGVTGDSTALAKIQEDPRQHHLVDTWKRFSRWCVSQPALSQSFTSGEEGGSHVFGQVTDGDVTINSPDKSMVNLCGGSDAPRDSEMIYPPVVRAPQWGMMRQLETYVDNRSPVFVDNALFLKPIQVSSLYSWRLKRKLHALERAHDKNAMTETICYMFEKGLWRTADGAADRCVPREQPLWRHLFTIVSALHKLNFTSFGLIEQAVKSLQLSEPVVAECGDGDDAVRVSRETCSALLSVVRHFGHMVSAISGLLSRDASGEMAARFLDVFCNSNALKVIEVHAVERGATASLADVTDIFRKFNMLVFFSYGRLALPNGKAGSTAHVDIVAASKVDLKQASQDVTGVYDSLCTISGGCISALRANKGIDSMAADEGARDLIRLMNEVTYGQWALQRSCWNEDSRDVVDNLARVGKRVADALLDRLEGSKQLHVALYGLCAIRRHQAVCDVSRLIEPAGSGERNSDTRPEPKERRASRPGEERLRQIMERNGITEKAIENALCVAYDGKKPVESALGKASGDLKRGMVAVHTLADPAAAALGILHNFYLSHYNAV
ncbi:uncharacterized protein BcabD6B2_46130 [Babesia caballi]|uniref:Uncharacterized protein n=1 Tax=Babesia caballi TaxID=5871 RepID=A0AAV4LZM8_BABCB|nr:hypothetical protein, conserved [Babesia caballi]